MWITVLSTIILVQGMQMFGDNLAGKIANKGVMRKFLILVSC